MTTVSLANSAYADVQGSVRSPRETEFEALAQATHRMRSAGADFPRLVDAIHRNRLLWQTLAVNVADRENALPNGLRAQLFYLAEFTEHHSARVLSRLADHGVLIEINQTVMAGLSPSGRE